MKTDPSGIESNRIELRLPAIGWSCWTLPVFAIVLTLGMSRNPAFGQESWEYSPYRVGLWTVFSPGTPLTEADRQQLNGRLVDASEVRFQAAWQMDPAEPPEELLADLGLKVELVSSEDIEIAAPDILKADKLLMLVVSGTPDEMVITAREFDCRTRWMGPIVTRRLRQTQRLADEAFSALVDAFSAMVRIEAGEGQKLTVRLRAGGLIIDRNSPAYITIDDILQPIVRKNDRVGKPTSIEAVEWTFLQVASRGETNPNLLQVHVHSGWRAPIRGRAGSRREQYALAVRKTFPATRLFIDAKVGRNQEPYALAGLEIYAKRPTTTPPAKTAEERAAAENSNPAELLGYTDWRGSVEVPPGELPLQLIYIKNGGQLLARLPIVSGLSDTLTASVPDDDPRLQAEGFIQGFNAELMDVVAQRQILAARIRKRIEEKNAGEAEELVEKFRELPSRNDLTRRLDQQQNGQRVSPNKSVQARIDKLYAETRKALSKYLDPNLGNKLLQEMNQARQSAE